VLAVSQEIQALCSV